MGIRDRELKRVPAPERSVAGAIINNIKNTGKPGRPPKKEETKKAYSMTILPSVWNKAKETAFEQRTSISQVVSDFLEEYGKSSPGNNKKDWLLYSQ